MSNTIVSRSELILGGQRSGKSRRAETLAIDWLQAKPSHEAIFIATAQAWDEEMAKRIKRHQQDRAERLPRMTTLEVPRDIADGILAHSTPNTLIVIDCLTLWLTNLLMPAQASDALSEAALSQAVDALVQPMAQAPGPLVFVSNEIGLGVIPMGKPVRAFIDEQGRLNQRLASVCQRVTLMAAGLPLTLKSEEGAHR